MTDKTAAHRTATQVIEGGRRPEWTHGVVNPPVYHASTCVFPTLAAFDAALRNPGGGLFYGRHGTPTTWALEEALTRLEPGAAGTKLFPSGVAAISTALFATLKGGGEHILMVDSVYEPTRAFCDKMLAPLGVETTYYDPTIGAGIAELIRPNTRAVFTESPGSLTFEVQDLPAIAEVAHAHGAAVILDNTWATSLYQPSLPLGVDMCAQSLTKYVGGHSDLMMGAVTANEQWLGPLKAATARLGHCVGPDDAMLALRGLRTLDVRLERHHASGLRVAQWLAEHPLVERVIHPALPGCPGHELWKRDFKGATGLFAVVLNRGQRADLAAMVDHMHHFKMGFSWGGYESLILPINPASIRTATRWHTNHPMLRLHIGLEDPQDLINDLAQGLERYAAATAENPVA
ncbi:cystathionine beta-lyase [Pedomonas mirosovicensis]|uniref:cystathionine beta-lyase n=1 Tax=Pedomonas mirosovicensis TaxID=2908641 RepID=UPI00216A432E|nr:cystathionine beta-lyase [Pedomonas mirosovicensis]MCH8684774.1 cystathionine beta-lyase [Pedomonas mirosovicensis]